MQSLIIHNLKYSDGRWLIRVVPHSRMNLSRFRGDGLLFCSN